MAAAAAAKKCSELDGQAPESTDFANYFCTYGFLYHQKDMLEDHKRTGAYYNAILQNRRQFQGKVILDVGTGSGILAIFAAMAGARKVYAVEATDMAHSARKLVAHNKFAGVIEVVQGTIETISLPEKVDVIVSEWMGYFLLRESMLDSVLVARDRFLKPGGALYPSHARMFLAPIRSNSTAQRASDLKGTMEGWGEFLEDMKEYYNVDLSVLTDDFASEQRDYYLATSAWGDVHPSQLVGVAAPFHTYDLHKVTLDELRGVDIAPGGRGQVVVALLGGKVVGENREVDVVVLLHVLQELAPPLHRALEVGRALRGGVAADGGQEHAGVGGVQRAAGL